MIFRRTIANLRAQNWTAIVIEIVIVVVGVFIGTQVSNWNDARIERTETQRMLQGLRPELRNMLVNFRVLRDYYRVSRRYGTTAFAGWRGDPGVSDRDFVIAAYQASQNTFTGLNSGSWSEIFGAQRFQGVGDQALRDELSVLMTQDYTVLEKELFTEYRQNVRKIIPEDIQDGIRAQCGDQRVGSFGFVRLPATCDLQFPAQRWSDAARTLRAHPELADELRWHFAAVATYDDNIANLQTITQSVLNRLERA